MTKHRTSPRLLLYVALLAAVFASTPAWAQLSRVSDNYLLAAVPMRGTDTAYDPVNGVYLVVGSIANFNPVWGVFVNASGLPVTGVFPINAGGENASFPRAVYSRDLAGGAGGFLVTYNAGMLSNTVRTKVVVYPTGPVGAETVVPSLSNGEMGNSIAYSPVSRVFMIVWQSTVGQGVWGARVDTNGQNVGSPFQISDGSLVGARDPNVAWNPNTNEFGVVYTGWGVSGATTSFARVNTAGTVLRRNTFNFASGTYITDIGFSALTGRFVVAWFQLSTGTLGAEIDSNGDVVTQGLLSSVTGQYDGLGLSYNASSGTFLLVGHGPSYNVWGAELNYRGARTSPDFELTAAGGPKGSFYPRATANANGRQWNISFGHNFTAMRDQVVATSSTGGGPGGSLGAVSGGGGTTAPPPPPPAPGGCPGTAPFPGAVCVNGGWVPGTTGGGTVGAGGCTSPAPGAGWTCVNGGWVPGTSAGSTGGCPGTAPFAGAVCVNGGWVPGTAGGSTSGCASPSPGAGWVCVNGGWVPGTAGGSTSGCASPSPGAGWVCVNGGWVPGTAGGSTSGCASPSPGAGWACVNGGWVPGTMTGSTGGCTTPSPGAGWACVNGGWIPGTMTGGGCASPSPGAGWACVNGGWLPPGTVTTVSPLSTSSSGGCTTSDPFTAIGGGVCVNGGWRPRN